MKYISVFLLLFASVCLFAQDNTQDNPQEAIKEYTLEECISLAIDNNTDLKQERNKIITAVANKEIAISDYYPKISAKNNTFEDKLHNDSDFQSGTTTTAELKIFDTGLRYLSVKSATKSEAQTKLTTFRKYQTVIYNVINSYYNSLRYAELMDLKVNSINYYAQQETEYKEKISLGEKAPVDIYPVQASLANAKVDLLTATNAFTNSKRELLNLMGIKDTGEIKLAPASTDVENLDVNIEECIKIANENRADLQAGKFSIESAKINKKMADMQLWPLFYVSASYTYDFKNTYENTDKHDDGKIGGYISWNIFDGFNTQAKIKQSKVKLDDAIDSTSQIERDIITDIKNTFTNINIAKEQMTASQIGFDSANKNREVQTGKFDLNMNTNLDILNAQVQYDQAMSNLITVKYDLKLSYIDLEYQTGMLGMDNEIVLNVKK